jgi:hypothetical protein
VNIPGVQWEIAPELLIAPLKGDCPEGPLYVLHDVDIAAPNIVLDSLPESRAGQPLGFKPPSRTAIERLPPGFLEPYQGRLVVLGLF